MSDESLRLRAELAPVLAALENATKGLREVRQELQETKLALATMTSDYEHLRAQVAEHHTKIDKASTNITKILATSSGKEKAEDKGSAKGQWVIGVLIALGAAIPGLIALFK